MQIIESMISVPHTIKNVGFAYWIGAVGLLSWFFFIHSPPIFANNFRRPLFDSHIVGVGWLCLACIHNAIITPSVRSEQHVVMGRSGLYLGGVGYVSGCILALQSFSKDPTFAIAITAGGTMSGYAAIAGYRDIQEYKSIEAELQSVDTALTTERRTDLEKASSRALKSHIQNMLGVFIMGCLLPAAIRVVEDSQYAGWYIAAAVIGFNTVAHHYSTKFQNGRPQSFVYESPTSEASALLAKDHH